MLALHIKFSSRLEEETPCKFLKHCVIVLGIVTGDVPDLENYISYITRKLLVIISPYLGHNLEAVAHLIERLAKAHAIMGCIHLNKAKQGLLDSPLPRFTFFNPVAGHSKVRIGIASLPCVTC